ncbi:hypothetical protein [Streptomyces chartreusis]|uniref:hypothetical protein n=1 Tax=Streptomyces chartreusis TaxID=1969 RepID=UPI0033AC9CB3
MGDDLGDGAHPDRGGLGKAYEVGGKDLLVALINHEYQHDQWISEVRADNLGHALPPDPESDRLSRVDGYLVCNPYA